MSNAGRFSAENQPTRRGKQAICDGAQGKIDFPELGKRDQQRFLKILKEQAFSGCLKSQALLARITLNFNERAKAKLNELELSLQREITADLRRQLAAKNESKASADKGDQIWQFPQ